MKEKVKREAIASAERGMVLIKEFALETSEKYFYKQFEDFKEHYKDIKKENIKID